VDGRIEAGFRMQLGRLLTWAGHRDAPGELERLVADARRASQEKGMALPRALANVYVDERERTRAQRRAGDADQQASNGGWRPAWSRFDAERPPRFLCDPSTAGLGRWLRAAGYEAVVDASIPGHRLPDEALARGLVLLTTEAEVLERRIVANGSLVVAWVPSALTMREQLTLVMGDLGLGLREPRCMACGGALMARDKEAVRPRIPPRTALWKDEYFVCAGCDRLFWQGTHWERIAPALAAAASGGSGTGGRG
jgi:uncharacterized protein with PIN domain